MKSVLFIILALVLIASGVFLYNAVQPDDELTQNNTITGVVTGVDRSRIMLDGPTTIEIKDDYGGTHTIAVPSMGINLCAANEMLADTETIAVGDTVSVRGSIDEENRIVPCADAADYLRVQGVATDATFGYEFPYHKGPDGYVTLEDNESTQPDFVTGLTLMEQREFESFSLSTEPREGPPTINLRIFTNPSNLHASVWARQHSLESNYELRRGEAKEVVVAGANGVSYLVDGLYPIDTYVIAHGEHVYVLSGAYLDEGDQIREDFRKIINTFTFIKPETVVVPAPETDNPPREGNAIVCTKEQKEATACTMEYAPVCGLVAVQCITTPCNPVPETFSNGCMACAQGNVLSYTPGACEV